MNKKVLQLETSRDSVKKVRQLTRAFCIFRFTDISERELDLLVEILYSKGDFEEAKNAFMINYDLTEVNYNVVKSRLFKKGILKKKDNKLGMVMHEELDNLNEYVITGGCHIFIKNNEPN